MVLENYRWTKKETKHSEYAARFVTHDIVNKRPVLDQMRGSHIKPKGVNSFDYDGEEVSVEFDINNRWAAAYVDEAFLEQMGGKDFSEAVLDFLEPGEQRGLEDY